MTSPLLETIASSRAAIERELDRLLPPADTYPGRLHEAQRYALLSGGKRLRPILTLIVARMYGVQETAALPAACAIEMVHASSLILDDLPCMDDATLRRGQPACHRIYGEATAILAAVGLLDRAFAILVEEDERAGHGDRLARRLTQSLSAAIGSSGILGGQHVDLESAGRAVDFDTLEYIHSHKTGALFIAAASAGALIGGAPRAEMEAIHDFAKNLGLAFQVTDDLLDVTASSAVTGKDAGQDRGKTTFVSFAGVAGAHRLVDDLVAAALAALAPLKGRAADLIALAEMVRTRDR